MSDHPPVATHLHGLTREQIIEKAMRSAAEQGLPPTIEDPEILEKIASLFGLTRVEGG